MCALWKKKCTKCKKIQSLDEFGFSPKNERKYRNSWCKTCMIEATNKWYKDNLGKARALKRRERKKYCKRYPQKVRIEKAHPEDKYGDVLVDTNRSFEIYKEWLKKTRPAPGPGGLRRPLWLNRPLRPLEEMFYIDS